MITFHGVTKDYDGHIALNHLDLTIEDGQIVGLIGHNGAGKSTTIKSLVSVITPTLVPLKWMVRTSIAIDWRSKRRSVMWQIRQIFSCVSQPMNSGSWLRPLMI